jgi:hypothetical protein
MAVALQHGGTKNHRMLLHLFLAHLTAPQRPWTFGRLIGTKSRHHKS